MDIWDKRKNAYIKKDVIFKSSIPVGMMNGYSDFFGLIAPRSGIILQKLYYQHYPLKKSYESKKYVYCVLSRENLQCLQQLYYCNLIYSFVNERFGSFYQTKVGFSGDVPLQIVLGKNGKVLKNVLPVAGYEYTEEQLAAIEKFNTLYP